MRLAGPILTTVLSLAVVLVLADPARASRCPSPNGESVAVVEDQVGLRGHRWSLTVGPAGAGAPTTTLGCLDDRDGAVAAVFVEWHDERSFAVLSLPGSSGAAADENGADEGGPEPLVEVRLSAASTPVAVDDPARLLTPCS